MKRTTKKTTKELSFEIGGYSNQVQAEQEAKDFRLPTVFARRSGVLPDPRAFRVEIEPVSAIVQPWNDPPSPLNQFYIALKLKATAATEKAIDDWARKLNAAIAIFHASSVRNPGMAGERAAHLKFMAEQKKAKKT